MEKTLGGLYIENGVLYDRQSLWPCRSSVGVHCYTFHTSARETYDMWLPARWGGLFRTLVQWKCVSCSHWWYLFSAFVPRTILRKWLACSLETGLDLWLCFDIVPGRNNEPRKSQWYANGFDNIAHVQSQHMWQTSTCTPRHQLPSKLRLMRLGLREYFLRTFTCLLLSFYISDHFAFVICVVVICYWFY